MGLSVTVKPSWLSWLMARRTQGRTGVDAEILGQPGPGLLNVVQRVDLAPASVERQHELPGEAFVERECGSPREQVRQDVGVPAAP
jgi:hypothetical protein